MWRPPTALIIGLLVAAPAWWPIWFGDSDHLVFWTAGHQVLVGGSPYDRGVWTALATSYPSEHVASMLQSGDEIWVYPPWTALLFAPFGALPAEIGAWALHLAYAAASAAAILIFASLVDWRTGTARSLAILMAITFEPLVVAARWGQFTSFVVLGAAFVLLAVRGRRPAWLAIGAALLTTKPQLGALAGAVVAGRLALDRDLRALLAAAVGVVAFAAVAIALQPAGLAVMARGAGQRVTAIDRFPTTWGAAHALLPNAWVALGVAAVIVAAVACVLAVRTLPSPVDAAIVGSLAFSAAAIPYALTYDHAILVPALVFSTAAADRSRGAARATLLAALVLYGATAWALFIATNQGPLLGVVPVIGCALFGASAILATRRPGSPVAP